jgi:type II secretory ATPase GspE/PulE/Tfp pilus assembly ATPase PilB-like protein
MIFRSLITRFFDTSEKPTASPRLRQAHEGPIGPHLAAQMPRAEVIQLPRHDAQPKLTLVAPDAAAIDIPDVSDLPKWRCVVPNLVRDADRNACVVLDLEMRTVLVLATQEFYASGSHSALQQALITNSWSVSQEQTCAAAVIELIHAENERRMRTASVAHSTDQEVANVQLYKDVMRGAFDLRASDIHIQLNKLTMRSVVRLRIDGRLRTWKTFDTDVLTKAVSAAYHSLSISGTNSAGTWTTDRPINTITKFNVGETVLQGRLSTQPISVGCKVEIRVIDATESAILNSTLQDSGYTEQQINEDLLPGLAKTKGFILVGGSTGDGKTQTIYRMLVNMPARDELAIHAIEDPVEMSIPGVEHVSIQRNPDDSPATVQLKYESALINQMRQDPDVIFQGEIRDKISGAFASDAVMTGHLLIVSMHGNSAVGQILRLLEDRIDISPEVLADEENFVLSMSQKLVPTLCTYCRVPALEHMPAADLNLLRNKFHLNPSTMYCARDGGCEHCKPEADIVANGYRGRTVAAEIITHPTAEFLDCVRARDRRGAEAAWRRVRRSGFDSSDMRGKTAYEHALYLVSIGKVSPLSLVTVFGKTFEEADVFELKTLDKDAA